MAGPMQIRTFIAASPAALLGIAFPAGPVAGTRPARALMNCWKTTPGRARGLAPVLQAVAESASLRADYEAVVARHGRSQTHKALAAALAKRVEFDLADDAGVVDALGATVPAGVPRPGGVRQSLPRPCRSAACPAALAQPCQRFGRRGPTRPRKGGGRHHRRAGLPRPGTSAWTCCAKRCSWPSEDRLSKNLEKFPAAQEAEPELQRLLVARRQHEAWQHQQRMARLARCLIAQFAAVKQQHGWVDMNDVERTALVMLADPILSGWVQERLDARIRHLLVDEFQDTNPLQWQALHAWLAGCAGSGGGSAAPSVFIVGDPKQSIYRFRRAEPQVFIAAQAFVRDGLGGDLLELRPHAPQRAGRDCRRQRRHGPGPGAAETSGFRDHTT